MDDTLNWIDSKALLRPEISQRKPLIDVEVSKIVGKPVAITDPRLIGLIVKWKKAKANPDEDDNFLLRPQFLIELKETFK